MFRNNYLAAVTEDQPTSDIKFQLIADILTQSRFPTDAFKPGYVACFFERLWADKVQDQYTHNAYLEHEIDPTGRFQWVYLADMFIELCNSMKAKRFIWSELADVVSNIGDPLTFKTGAAWLEEHKALAPTISS